MSETYKIIQFFIKSFKEKYMRLNQMINNLYLQLLSFIRAKIIHEPFWLIVNWKLYRIYVGNLSGNYRAYKDVFLKDYYGVFDYSKKSKPNLIVDIGAHVGMFSKLCSVLFPNAEILAYEPYPPSFEMLKKNARGTYIKTFPYAVLDKSGSVMLDSTGCSPLTVRVSPKGKLEAQGIAASEIAKGRIIDLLKMDCEGSEWSILKDVDFLRRVKNLRMEYDLDDNHTVQELEEMVSRAGHKVLRILPTPEIGKCGCGILWSTNTSFL